MPIGNFNKCLSGDLSYLSKNKYYSIRKAYKLWPSIFDQNLRLYGLPEEYERYLNTMVKAMQEYSKAYNGQKWRIVKAKMYRLEAEQILSAQGESIDNICAMLSKFMGFPIRPYECTVTEFNSYIATIR